MKKDKLDHFRFFETMLYWEGRVNCSHISKHFNVTRQAVMKWVNEFEEIFQGQFSYCETEKAYIADDSFKPKYISENFDEYRLIVGGDIIAGFGHDQASHIYCMNLPLRNNQAKYTRQILHSCRNSKRIDITYLSMREEGEINSIISPHALIFDGRRWHVRAFCEASDRFKDFSLSRILSTEPNVEGKVREGHKRADDIDWNTQVTLTIIPDLRLNDHEKRVIEYDYQMVDSKVHIPTNKALVNYLISLLGLATQNPNPQAQQISIEPDCYLYLREHRYFW